MVCFASIEISLYLYEEKFRLSSQSRTLISCEGFPEHIHIVEYAAVSRYKKSIFFPMCQHYHCYAVSIWVVFLSHYKKVRHYHKNWPSFVFPNLFSCLFILIISSQYGIWENCCWKGTSIPVCFPAGHISINHALWPRNVSTSPPPNHYKNLKTYVFIFWWQLRVNKVMNLLQQQYLINTCHRKFCILHSVSTWQVSRLT